MWLLAPGHTSGVSEPPVPMDALRAYQTAVDLVKNHGRATESLPYFRRALDLRSDLWQVRCDYGAALMNAVGEALPGPGPTRSTTRSSWERAAMVHEALAELDRAERLAWAAADRAYVVAIRAQALALWGLSWNGLEEYARARQIDPSSTILRARHAQLWRIMRDPLWSSR